MGKNMNTGLVFSTTRSRPPLGTLSCFQFHIFEQRQSTCAIAPNLVTMFVKKKNAEGQRVQYVPSMIVSKVRKAFVIPPSPSPPPLPLAPLSPPPRPPLRRVFFALSSLSAMVCMCATSFLSSSGMSALISSNPNLRQSFDSTIRILARK